MLHHRPRIAGLLAILAVLVLTPSALAVSSAKKAASVTKSEQRAYGKHCKTAKGRSSERTKCLRAMAELDRGRKSSPSRACRELSRKKAKNQRRSAYARCVSEGGKLLKAKRRGRAASADGGEPDEAYGDGPGVPEGDEGEAPEAIDEAPGIEEPDDALFDDFPLDDEDG